MMHAMSISALRPSLVFEKAKTSNGTNIFMVSNQILCFSADELLLVVVKTLYHDLYVPGLIPTLVRTFLQ